MAKDRVFLDELLVNIFGYVSATDLTRVSLVCKQWRRVSKSPELWKKLVLLKWPTQKFLYEKVNVRNLQWRDVYIELYQKSWFSPDNMKYFISCKAMEDELASAELRQAMFEKMATVSQKWMQVFPFEMDDPDNHSFDKNAELYYDINQLKWIFLDRRRGYMRDLFPSQKLKAVRRNKKIRHIRTYQVIPSCLVLYRWLCLFKAFATAEDGLTFYRIWRFRLKHLETGKIFEIYDWKAAMNTTFSNGMPKDSIYRNDALELLDLLTHQHFIMHPLGLQPTLSNASRYLACSSAGGVPWPQVQLERRERRKRKIRMLSSSCQNIGVLGLDRVSDRAKIQNELFDDDNTNQVENKTFRSKVPLNVLSPLTSPIPRISSSQSFTYDKQCFSRQSSSSSILSDTEDSERSEKESDVDSEYEGNETGYASNCEYFIVTTHSFDIEEQHSIQASISDSWMVTHKSVSNTSPVLFCNAEGSWYFPSDRNDSSQDLLNIQGYATGFTHSRSGSDVSMQSDSNLDHLDEHHPIKRPFSGSCAFSSKLKDLDKTKHGDSMFSPLPSTSQPTEGAQNTFLSNESRRTACTHFLPLTDGSEFEHRFEAIPSCLAIYRLICLFDLNCSMYKSTDDSSIWSVKMLHKKTGGIMLLQDYNGMSDLYLHPFFKLY